MTIGAWIAFGFLSMAVLLIGILVAVVDGRPLVWVVSLAIVAVLIFGMWFGFNWYYKNTASGQRELIDQKSNLNNGIERTVTVYTADGNVIAKYEGKIDIDTNDGGYIKFDFQGKRYIYYNCFVETIAHIN